MNPIFRIEYGAASITGDAGTAVTHNNISEEHQVHSCALDPNPSSMFAEKPMNYLVKVRLTFLIATPSHCLASKQTRD